MSIGDTVRIPIACFMNGWMTDVQVRATVKCIQNDKVLVEYVPPGCADTRTIWIPPETCS